MKFVRKFSFKTSAFVLWHINQTNWKSKRKTQNNKYKPTKSTEESWNLERHYNNASSMPARIHEWIRQNNKPVQYPSQRSHEDVVNIEELAWTIKYNESDSYNELCHDRTYLDLLLIIMARFSYGIYGPNNHSRTRNKWERDRILKGDKSLKSRGFHTRANAEYFSEHGLCR